MKLSRSLFLGIFSQYFLFVSNQPISWSSSPWAGSKPISALSYSVTPECPDYLCLIYSCPLILTVLQKSLAFGFANALCVAWLSVKYWSTHFIKPNQMCIGQVGRYIADFSRAVYFEIAICLYSFKHMNGSGRFHEKYLETFEIKVSFLNSSLSYGFTCFS